MTHALLWAMVGMAARTGLRNASSRVMKGPSVPAGWPALRRQGRADGRSAGRERRGEGSDGERLGGQDEGRPEEGCCRGGRGQEGLLRAQPGGQGRARAPELPLLLRQEDRGRRERRAQGVLRL